MGGMIFTVRVISFKFLQFSWWYFFGRNCSKFLGESFVDVDYGIPVNQWNQPTIFKNRILTLPLPLLEKYPNMELFLVRIFLYSCAPLISVFTPNTEKYGPDITLYLDTFHVVSPAAISLRAYSLLKWLFFTFKHGKTSK